jgi:hypothetical protein
MVLDQQEQDQELVEEEMPGKDVEEAEELE